MSRPGSRCKLDGIPSPTTSSPSRRPSPSRASSGRRSGRGGPSWSPPGASPGYQSRGSSGSRPTPTPIRGRGERTTGDRTGGTTRGIAGTTPWWASVPHRATPRLAQWNASGSPNPEAGRGYVALDQVARDGHHAPTGSIAVAGAPSIRHNRPCSLSSDSSVASKPIGCVGTEMCCAIHRRTVSGRGASSVLGGRDGTNPLAGARRVLSTEIHSLFLLCSTGRAPKTPRIRRSAASRRSNWPRPEEARERLGSHNPHESARRDGAPGAA